MNHPVFKKLGTWSAILLSFISWVSCGSAFSQTEELRYSTLMFLRPREAGGGNNEVYVTVGNQSLFRVGPAQIASYRIYSTGDIPIKLTITNKKGERSFIEGRYTFDVNNVYYFKIGPKEGITPITKEEKEALMSKFSTFTDQKEDLKYPIDRNSFVRVGQVKGRSQGSCFLVNKDGYLLTNYHVIKSARMIKVLGIPGYPSIPIEAVVVGTDEKLDLALLRVPSKLITFSEPPYAFVPAKTVQQGESVVALGYPIRQVMGEEVKVTNGIINAKSGYKGAISEFQFSAAVQPGNSGGPLLNGQGQVVGMVTAKLNPEVTESVGYAVKSDHLMFFLDQFEGVNYRRAEASDAAPTLPQVVSASAPFVFVVETE
jgi:S1-C subfamily serine protease